MFKGLIFFVLSVYLALTFTTAGANKLFALEPKTHEYIVNSSKYWVQTFSGLFNAIGYTPSTDGLRQFLGVSELLGAGALLLSSVGYARCMGTLATFGLISIMIGAVYLHNEFNTSVATPALILGLLVVRLILTPRCSSGVCVPDVASSKKKN